jgi:hypothetical protein
VRPWRRFLATFAVKVFCLCSGKSKAVDRKERREVSPSLQREVRKEDFADKSSEREATRPLPELTSLILRDDSMPSSSGLAAKAPDLIKQVIQFVNEGTQYDNIHRTKRIEETTRGFAVAGC